MAGFKASGKEHPSTITWGSFNNYVDKKRGLGVSGKSTLGHVTKGRLDSM